MWYYPAADLKSWDFLPSASGGGVVVLDGEVANVAELGAGAVNKRWSGPNGRTVVSNSQLREVSPRGELRRQYIQGCSGPVSSYNAFAHEVGVGRVLREEPRAPLGVGSFPPASSSSSSRATGDGRARPPTRPC